MYSRGAFSSLPLSGGCVKRHLSDLAIGGQENLPAVHCVVQDIGGACAAVDHLAVKTVGFRSCKTTKLPRAASGVLLRQPAANRMFRSHRADARPLARADIHADRGRRGRVQSGRLICSAMQCGNSSTRRSRNRRPLCDRPARCGAIPPAIRRSASAQGRYPASGRASSWPRRGQKSP